MSWYIWDISVGNVTDTGHTNTIELCQFILCNFIILFILNKKYALENSTIYLCVCRTFPPHFHGMFFLYYSWIAWFYELKSLISRGLNKVNFSILANKLFDELTNYGITSDEFVEVVSMRNKNVKDTRITI